MWTRTKNYLKIDQACSTLINMNRISFLSGSYDTPSNEIWTLIRVVITALVCPRVDFFQASDGRSKFSEHDALSIVFSTSDSFADKNWERLTVLEQYVDRNNCAIWTDGSHSYVALRSGLEVDWFKLVSGIVLLCPCVFADKPLNSIEKEFLKIISDYGKNFDEKRFDEICGILYKNIGIDKLLLEKVAYTLTKKSYDKRIENIKSNIESYRHQIQYYENEISSYLNEIQNQTIELNGLYAMNNNGQDELLEFLKSADIHDIKIGNEDISFTVHSLLSCYEEGQVEPYILNSSRVLSGGRSNSPYTEQEMKSFYKAVFVDKTLWIKLAAMYSISMKIRVEAQSLGSTIDPDRINNPNIGYAGCLGGYRGDLDQAREANDPIAALSICQQSACSVNLGEIWPMEYVTRDLFASKGKVIHTDDGDITFAEAMERIKAQMNEE